MQNKTEVSILDRIFFLIEHQGLTKKRVSEDLGLSASYFAERKYQNRAPSSSICQKIADYFGVSLSWILTGSEEQNSLDENLYILLKEIDSLSEKQKEFFIKSSSSFIQNLKEFDI